MLKPTSILAPQKWLARFGQQAAPQATVAVKVALTPEQRKERAKAQASGRPVGYLARMIKAEGNAEQNAIAHAADLEINGLRAIIRSLGGEV